MNEAVEERAGRENDGTRTQPAAIAKDDAFHHSILRAACRGADNQIFHAAFDHSEVCGFANSPLHSLAIKFAIRLGPRTVDSRTLGPVQEAKLNASLIRHLAHEAVERIDLADQMALAQAADGRVARHLSNGVGAVGNERRKCANARTGSGRLAAGMPAAHDDDVKIQSVGSAGVHDHSDYPIPCRQKSGLRAQVRPGTASGPPLPRSGLTPLLPTSSGRRNSRPNDTDLT